jgi:hypothetical protein
MNDQDLLTRVVVDVEKRTFYLYSEEGDDRTVTCDTVNEFMNVLKLCRDMLDEETLVYTTL